MELILPMLLKSGGVAFDDAEHLFEIKFDGVRAVLDRREKTLIYNRKGNMRTHLYPEVALCAQTLVEAGAVIDGEIIAFDKSGRQSFYEVLRRDLKKRHSCDGIEVCFAAFDILYYKGESVIKLPLIERKKLLDKAVENGRHIKKVDFYVGEGKLLFEAAKNNQMEGIVAKRIDSVYTPNVRSGDWLKIKCKRQIVAYALGYQKTASRISVLLGIENGGGYLYIGNVSNGLDLREWTRLERAFEALQSDKKHFAGFEGKNVRYLEPVIMLKIEYLELDIGGKLRQPIIKEVFKDGYAYK